MQKIHAANISLYFVTLVPPNTSDIGILSSISSVFFTSSGVNKISDAPAFSFKRSSFLVPGIGTRYVWISFLLYKFFYYIFLMDIKEPVSIYLYLPSATRYLIACLAFGSSWTSSKIITEIPVHVNIFYTQIPVRIITFHTQIPINAFIIHNKFFLWFQLVPHKFSVINFCISGVTNLVESVSFI